MVGDENLLLYVNLAGELFYIIVHRMGSQGIRYDLQKRVYDDLALVICNPQVVQDLLVGKINLIHYSLTELKMMLSSIVHSSIMNINDYSMEKLFELTLIATKYQYSVCPNPSHVLLIALNHVDSMRKHLTDPLSIQSAENLHFVLVESYSIDGIDGHGLDNGFISPVNGAAMKRFQESILNYLGDVRLKMTNLIKLGLQSQSGEFVIDEVSKQYKDEKVTPVMLELYGDRKTRLGMSIYDMEVEPGTAKHQQAKTKRKPPPNRRASEPAHLLGGTAIKDSPVPPVKSELENDANQILKAIQGLDLCGTLLGCNLEAENESKTKSKVPTRVEGLRSGTEKPAAAGAAAVEGRRDSKSGSDFNVVRIDGAGNTTQMSEFVKKLDLDMPAAESADAGAGPGLGIDEGSNQYYSGTTAQLLELAMDNNEDN